MNKSAAFVLASTNQGMFIVNRFDRMQTASGGWYGVGLQLLETGSYDPEEINLILHELDKKRQQRENGVVFIDCGANIGVHTICAARHMHEWGTAHAFEPQERLYHALCGNIAINNLENVHAYFMAVGSYENALHQQISIPQLDYNKFGSYGSLSLKGSTINDTGQHFNKLNSVKIVNLDTFANLNSIGMVDFIKIDVEGMELDVLKGAKHLIEQNKPTILVEFIKSNKHELINWLQTADYTITEIGINLLATR